MAKTKDHGFFDAVKSWSTEDLAMYLLRAVRIMSRPSETAGSKADLTHTAKALKALAPLYVSAHDTVRSALEMAVRDLNAADALRLPNAMTYLLKQAEHPLSLDEVTDLIWLLVTAGFAEGESVAYLANDWLRINCRKADASPAYEALVYLLGNNRARATIDSFLSKVSSEGALTAIVIEAALRVAATNNPSHLPYLMSMYGKALEDDDTISSRDIQDVVRDLVSRSNLQIVVKSFAYLDPHDTPTLFESAFSVEPDRAPLFICHGSKPTKKGSVTSRLKVYCEGWPAEDLSELFHLTVGHDRGVEWKEGLQEVLNRQIGVDPKKEYQASTPAVAALVQQMNCRPRQGVAA